MLSKPWLRFVGGKERWSNVYVEGQQIADCVMIFGAVQTAEGVGAAGVGLGCGGLVQRGLQ